MFVVEIRAVDNNWYPVVSYENFDRCYLFILKQIVIYGHQITRYKVRHADFEIIFLKN